MLRAERNKAVLMNRNIFTGFSVEQATGRAVKKPDFEHTVHPITAVHVMAIIRDRGIKAQVFSFREKGGKKHRPNLLSKRQSKPPYPPH